MKALTNHLFVFIFLMSACGCKNKISLDNDAIPETLLIGVFAGEGQDAIVERLGPIKAYLERKLEMPVDLIMTTDYTTVIEALHSKKVHVAYLPPFSYVLASKRGDLDILVALGLSGKPHYYKSVIITNKNSGIKDMDDVKTRSRKLTLCFPDPASASGHLIPRAYLNSIGLNPQHAFKETLFASSHTASIMTVKSGKMDIGCTSYTYLKKLIGKGIVDEKEIVILWMSDPIVSGPIVIRKDINREFVKRVQQAYLDLPSEDHNAWDNYLTQIYGKDKNDSLRYIIAYDSTYNGIRKIMTGVDEENLIQ